MQETGPTGTGPYPRRLERLTIFRCHCKGSKFSSVILRPWVLVRSGAWTLNLPHGSLSISTPLPNKIRQLHFRIDPTLYQFESTVCSEGGTDLDIRDRIGKAKGAFAKLRPVRRSGKYNRSTKITIWQVCVLYVLLYVSEGWRMTMHDLKKLQCFRTSWLLKILHIFRPRNISNNELFILTKQRTRALFTKMALDGSRAS